MTIEPDFAAAVSRESAFVRSLAHSLARDPHTAEDIAQEALLAALDGHAGRRSRAIESGLRSWLSRVVRNIASNTRRRHGRRRAREEAVARKERLPSALAIEAQLELARQLADRLNQLDEPYRTILLLRFRDGLPPRAIAAQLELPASTVKTRIARGLEVLRRRLPAEWASYGLGAGLAVGRAPSWIRSSVLVPASGVAFSVAVVALVLGRSAVAPPGLSAPTLEEARRAETALDANTAGGFSLVHRRPAAQQHSLNLRVLDLDGHPVTGAAVHAARAKKWPRLLEDLVARWEELGIDREAMGWVGLSGERELPPVPGTEAEAPFLPLLETKIGVSDADGTLSLSVLDGQRVLLRHPNYAPALLNKDALSATEELTVRMQPKGDLTVRFRDGEGSPVERVYVRVERARPIVDTPPIFEPWHDELDWHGPADAKGGITLNDLPAGVPLFVTPFGHFRRRPIEVTIDPVSGRTELDVRVWRVGTLQGLVLDHDEMPVEGYGVAYALPWNLTSDGTRRVATDAEGRFRFDAVIEGAGKVLFGVPTNGMFHQGASFEERPAEVFADWTTTLDPMILPPPAKIEGRVLGLPDGLHPCIVQVWREGRQFERTTCDDSGRFAFSVPTGKYAVGLSTNIWSPTLPLALVPVRAPTDDVVIDLRSLIGGIRGRLVGAQIPEQEDSLGTPTVKIRLLTAHGTRQSALRKLFEVPVRIEQSGSFEAGGLPTGTWHVQIIVGEGRAWIPNVLVEEGKPVDVGEVSLAPASISGRLLDPFGNPVAGGEVSLIHLDLRRSTPKRSVLSDNEGLYRFEDVPAGWIWLYAANEAQVAATIEADLRGGENARHDLVLGQAASLEGVISRGGRPLADANVSLFFTEPTSIKAWAGPSETTTDERGRFRLAPLLPGPYRISAHPPLPYTNRDAVGFDVSLEAGHEESVDIALPARESLLRIPEVGAIDYVLVMPLGGPREWTGREIRGAEAGSHTFRVNLPGRTHLALARVDGERALYGILEESLDHERLLVPSTGALELRTSAASLHGPRPKLLLLSVRGHPTGGMTFGRGIEPTLAGDRLRFSGLPYPSRIRLMWSDGHGREHSRDLDYEGPEPLVIEEL